MAAFIGEYDDDFGELAATYMDLEHPRVFLDCASPFLRVWIISCKFISCSGDIVVYKQPGIHDNRPLPSGLGQGRCYACAFSK